jgi:putative NADH-flavin reductase
MIHRVLILGATGGLGQQVLAQALEAGHDVTILARDKSKVTLQHPSLRVIVGTLPEDAAALAEAMRGQGVVISTLGRGDSFKSTGFIERCVPGILSAMQACRVRRLIFTSAIGVGGSFSEAPLLMKIFITLLLRDIYADKAAGDALIRESDLDWTIVRPARLTDGPLTGKYRDGERLSLSGMPSISRADLAHFILSQLDDVTHVRRIVTVAS